MAISQAISRTAKEQFDRQADNYNAQWNSWSEETLASLIEMAQPQSTDAVLDVATGTGFTALEFAPYVATVDAVDVSTGMLDVARKYAAERAIDNISFSEASAESLPFADGSFDIVTCRIAAHHFQSVRRAIRRGSRASAETGWPVCIG